MTLEIRTEAARAGIDVEQTLERLGGDEALLIELAGLMVDDAREMLGRIRGAVDRGEAPELRAAAHKAKGALAIFGSGNAVLLASQLERFGGSGEIVAARQTLPAFEDELALLLATLSRIAEA
jgi:HPt (histidine-containing phosphotransfer) domain-containing protein